MTTNMPAPDHLDELLCHLQCFSKDQRKKDRRDSEPDKKCPVFKRLQRHIGGSILTVLLVLTEYTQKYVCKPWGLGF